MMLFQSGIVRCSDCVFFGPWCLRQSRQLRKLSKMARACGVLSALRSLGSQRTKKGVPWSLPTLSYERRWMEAFAQKDAAGGGPKYSLQKIWWILRLLHFKMWFTVFWLFQRAQNDYSADPTRLTNSHLEFPVWELELSLIVIQSIPKADKVWIVHLISHSIFWHPYTVLKLSFLRDTYMPGTSSLWFCKAAYKDKRVADIQGTTAHTLIDWRPFLVT